MKEKIIYKGPDTLGILGIILIVLKLLNYISWSWWLVTAPFWIPAVLILGLIAIIAFIATVTVIVYILLNRKEIF